MHSALDDPGKSDRILVLKVYMLNGLGSIFIKL